MNKSKRSPRPVTRIRYQTIGLPMNNNPTPRRKTARHLNSPSEPPNGSFKVESDSFKVESNGPPEPPNINTNANTNAKKIPPPLPPRSMNPLHEDVLTNSELTNVKLTNDFIAYLKDLKNYISGINKIYPNRSLSVKRYNTPKKDYINGIIFKIDKKIRELESRREI